jgi:benzoyl-CoA reductase/2-hydroxyglutaryl-CoA dehydratase subunit BcrC/BadD/HgdB
MGFKLAGLCPYVELTDLLVGETTCDGKKKAYEIFNEITKKVYVMEIPNKKGEDGKKLWRNEVRRFAEKLEVLTDKKIALEKLKAASKIVNPHSISKCNTRRSDFKWCFKPQTLSGAIVDQ